MGKKDDNILAIQLIFFLVVVAASMYILPKVIARGSKTQLASKLDDADRAKFESIEALKAGMAQTHKQERNARRIKLQNQLGIDSAGTKIKRISK